MRMTPFYVLCFYSVRYDKYFYVKKGKRFHPDIHKAIVFPSKELARAHLYILENTYNMKIKRVARKSITNRQRGKAIAMLRIQNEKEQI